MFKYLVLIAACLAVAYAGLLAAPVAPITYAAAAPIYKSYAPAPIIRTPLLAPAPIIASPSLLAPAPIYKAPIIL